MKIKYGKCNAKFDLNKIILELIERLKKIEFIFGMMNYVTCALSFLSTR